MRRMIRNLMVLLCLVYSLTAVAEQPMNRVLDLFKGKQSPSASGLSQSRIAQGLKEALRVGTANTVQRTGKKNGYFGNPLIKILMPEKLQTVEKGLRLAGYGPKVDEFILSMNRAAEAAAPKAKGIFVDAITGMTFEDARQILNGGDTAATEFFKQRTSDSLYTAFRPIVDDTLNKVGTVQTYNAMMQNVRQLPFIKTESLEVGDYVTDKALNGLFLVLAEEEKQIRENPAARVTDLLRDVFGS
jgi:hypothetical protein